MDKNAIKKYAVWARNELIARVTQKAEQYEITEKKITPADADSIGGRVLTDVEKKQRQALIAKINQDGFGQVMEEVAYTWFNRFTALRFMEVNNYLPSHTRVFTNEQGDFKPQILADAIQLDLDGLNMDVVYELKNANKSEELYKYLLITQCNALSNILPGMFQKIEDYTELLLPDYLLREGSVIEQMISMIPESDFNVDTEDGQIEIIGWLYQYYISERHEEVVDPLHGKVVKKEEVPAATQLFTTDWVVRYLIDNSVGRYWVERNPNSKVADELNFYVDNKDGRMNAVDEKVIPQDVTTFDPCVGSGHFLIYAFDVLMKIYEEYGYTARDAAAEIVKNNLYGLDIDGRAAQLAYFSVMMKARQYDRRFFSRGIQPNVYEITESNNVDSLSVDYFCNGDSELKKDIKVILDTFIDAKEYGSILQIPSVNFDRIDTRFEQLSGEISMYNAYLLGDFYTLIKTAKVMSGKYAVVATNPPYFNKYDAKLKTYITENYKKYAGDLFSVFMNRNFGFCKENGYSGFMTPFVWMFIKKYEDTRHDLISSRRMVTLIQFEYSAYEEATVPICSFVLANDKRDIPGMYFKLSAFKGGMDKQRIKIEEALKDLSKCNYFYTIDQKEFSNIPSEPFAFWANDTIIAAFSSSGSLGDYALARNGMKTGDNDTFLRIWWEVAKNKLKTDCRNYHDAEDSKAKWFPYNKGGEYRKWYGNNDFIVNWENLGDRIFNHAKEDGRHVQDYPLELKFVPTLSWSLITSAKPAFRYKEGNLSDIAGMSLFTERNNIIRYLGLLNSCVSLDILQMLAPTINFQAGDIARIPVIEKMNDNDRIPELVEDNIQISKADWDAFETSWDFKSHPLAPMSLERQEQLSAGMNAEARKKSVTLLSERYKHWEQECEYRFSELQKNEEELNRIFIDIYGLQDELSSDVEDRDVTVRKADLQRDIRSLISYAVGCMFGRYSLDESGLAYAGGSWETSKYITFKPDKDAIIPICDDEYFDDDIVGRFVEFIETVYGKETLEENLRFIADALGGKGTSRDVIRNYFINDFYADHIKTYQKRPIYWLFDSGKKNGFKCLVYMHRYQSDTIARIRTDYVHEQQSRYRTAIADLEQRINGSSTSERVKLNKQLSTLQAQSDEIRKYEEKIHHLADQMISIDLDDGVKHNYELFKDVLAKIK